MSKDLFKYSLRIVIILILILTFRCKNNVDSSSLISEDQINITSISVSNPYNGETVIITGIGFSSSGNSVYLNSAANGSGTSIAQTIHSQSTTSIEITVIQGVLSLGTSYLIVYNTDGNHNSGYAVTLASSSTPTLVQKTPITITPTETQGYTATLTFGANVTQGNFISLTVVTDNIPFSVTDIQNNIWYQDAIANSTEGKNWVIVYHAYTKSSGVLAISIKTSGYAALLVGASEWSGIETGLIAGGTANNSVTESWGKSFTTGTISPSQNCLYIAGIDWELSNTTCTLDSSSWTSIHKDDTGHANGYANNYDTAYLIGTGSQKCTWTVTNNCNASAVIVAYAEQ